MGGASVKTAQAAAPKKSLAPPAEAGLLSRDPKSFMPTEFDIQYALENTQVLHEPDRRIDTFGSTQFEFQIVTELMDTVGAVRVREGRIEAEKPLILRPELPGSFDFRRLRPWRPRPSATSCKENLHKLAILKYGFKFRKGEISEQIVHESMDDVCGKLLDDIRTSGNPMRAVIQGVDDTWEICLLKFTVEMIEKSQNINLFDFKRRGLLG
jgi:hypothetical protein